ncbi:MAG: hypothetical protein J6Y98_04500 [Bacteroidales bacterium]|nr:hypothetical protein [Bacteroidales bacterium]
MPQEWIRQSSEYDDSNHGYHFNWYNLKYENYSKSQYPGFYAVGIREQVLYVNPYLNLIMVRIGKHNNGWTVVPVLFETLCHQWR